ncbi:unnamed protein product [Caenorhabditis angaria]|uniref:Nucleotide-diphospho-sugar transferase domain-containing protein n=1 Tax=Caenorhabditis angaria TaxID=860376 RepID=A0A9P1MYR6_9PELO|nr:unnamed protein product [Caenorhabditis angaria]
MRLSKFTLLLIFSTIILICLCVFQHQSNSHYICSRKVPQLQNKNVSSKLNIGIVIVLNRNSTREDYRIALDTVECYAKIQNYQFLYLNETDFDDRCKQPDYLFRRHCIVAQVLPEFDAIVFLDADIGVVNPNRRIEEFLDDSKDIIFYDRFFNWEVAMGSYIIRNTKYAKDALMNFSDYNYKLPNCFHGKDNGILQLFLAEFLFPQSQMQIENCQKIYNKSKSWDDLFIFQACIRAIMGTSTEFGKVRIMHKGKAWVRDNWLSNSKWNPETDFMFHAWKMNELEKTPKIVRLVENRYKWYNPLAGEINLKKCGPNNSTWNYDSRLFEDSHKILGKLEQIEKRIHFDFVKSISRMTEILNRK